MATKQIDFLNGAIVNSERDSATWRMENAVFARAQRMVTTLHKRECDNNISQTRCTIENVIAIMCADRVACKYSYRRNWEVDFVRFLLAFGRHHFL